MLFAFAALIHPMFWVVALIAAVWLIAGETARIAVGLRAMPAAVWFMIVGVIAVWAAIVFGGRT